MTDNGDLQDLTNAVMRRLDKIDALLSVIAANLGKVDALLSRVAAIEVDLIALRKQVQDRI